MFKTTRKTVQEMFKEILDSYHIGGDMAQQAVARCDSAGIQFPVVSHFW